MRVIKFILSGWLGSVLLSVQKVEAFLLLLKHTNRYVCLYVTASHFFVTSCHCEEWKKCESTSEVLVVLVINDQFPASITNIHS